MEEERLRSCLRNKKIEGNRRQWLYLDIDAASLLKECALPKESCALCCRIMVEEMLEGDIFLVKSRRRCASLRLTIRYYVDNLRIDRKSRYHPADISAAYEEALLEKEMGGTV